MELTSELIRTLAKTPYCRTAIAELADRFADLSPEAAGSLVLQLTELGEDMALNRLLNVCAYRGLPLDPTILAQSAGVIEDITHLPYCFAGQDAAAIDPLLEGSHSEELSWQRQAILVRLATELAMRHDTGQEDARLRLRSLLMSVTSYPADILVADTLRMLDSGGLEAGAFPLMTALDIRVDIPERPPPKVIGAGETVRRPIPKLGRNDPCHCGSGKKYKRCCLEKDREVLADASSHAGLTRSQIQKTPALLMTQA